MEFLRKDEKDREIARLISAIEKGFPVRPMPTRITECPCPECRDLHCAFYGREWKGISDRTLEANFSSLSLFSPQAFSYFLPAYLTYSLKHFVLFCDVLEFTIYALSPDAKFTKDPTRANWMKDRFKPLNETQCDVILKFLSLVARDEDLSGFHTQLDRGISHLKDVLRDLSLLN